MSINAFRIVFFLALMLTGFVAHGATTGPLSVDVMAGFSSQVAGGSGTTGAGGASVDYRFPNMIELGGEFTVGNGISQFALEANYWLNDMWWVGLQAGPMSGSGISGFGYGPQFGFDAPIGDNWTLGPEIQFQYANYSSGTNSNGGQFSTFFQPFAVLKYRFPN